MTKKSVIHSTKHSVDCLTWCGVDRLRLFDEGLNTQREPEKPDWLGTGVADFVNLKNTEKGEQTRALV